jgi:hypothetical protein
MIEIHKNKSIPSHAVTYITVWHGGWNENAGAAVFFLLWGREMKIMKNTSTFSLSLASSEPKSKTRCHALQAKVFTVHWRVTAYL